MDVLQRTQMMADFSSRTYNFAFSPSSVGSFSFTELQEGTFLQRLGGEVANFTTLAQGYLKDLNQKALMGEFPSLFSTSLGIANCSPYDIELSDTAPVRSPPYRCASPKLQVFKQIVNELLEQGVAGPSRSQYASSAFLVLKNGGGFRMVVDYRKINPKIVFDSYPMPNIEQAFEQFAGAVIFSVLDLNSAYFQVPLTPEAVECLLFELHLAYSNLIVSPWESVWALKG